MKIVELQKEYLGEASLLVNSVFGDEEEGVFPARVLALWHGRVCEFGGVCVQPVCEACQSG